MQYITASEGHDDDPDYHSYVLWATVCFLATAVGMVLTYLACYYCAHVRCLLVLAEAAAGSAVHRRVWAVPVLRGRLVLREGACLSFEVIVCVVEEGRHPCQRQ